MIMMMMKLETLVVHTLQCVQKHFFKEEIGSELVHTGCTSVTLMSIVWLLTVLKKHSRRSSGKWSLIDTGVMDDALPSSRNWTERRRKATEEYIRSEYQVMLSSSQRKPPADVSPVPPLKQQQQTQNEDIGRQTADRHSYLTTHLMEC